MRAGPYILCPHCVYFPHPEASMRKSPIRRILRRPILLLSLPRTMWLAILLVSTCAWLSHSDAAAQEQNPAPRSDVQPLAPNTALKDELETGANRFYSLQFDTEHVVHP